MNKKRKALLITILIVFMLVVLALCTGCNKQIFDTTWSFERAIIFLPDGEKLEGDITSWNDYDGSDMIQLEIDGKMYLTHSSNVVLISE